MAERRPLGWILQESGRITQDDVDRALAHQRTHGGFFGQALVSIGAVSREEIDWALASHFDLPYIFPNPEAVDRVAARSVPADWALAHLAVPIVRAGKTLTVVVADPLPGEVVDELRTRTGCDVEMALASAGRIRELIHTVYDASQAQRIDELGPMSLYDLIAHALDHSAERFGVSLRGTLAIGWWRNIGESFRAPLQDSWDDELVELIQPSSLDKLHSGDVRSEWQATLRRGAHHVPLEAHALIGASGADLMFQPLLSAVPIAVPSDLVLPPNLVKELNLLWRGGAARVGIGSVQVDVRALLPILPKLALGEHVRAVHINVTGESAGVFTLRASPDDAFASAIAAYELDAATLDLPPTGYPVRALLRAAPLSFMLLDDPEERAAPGDWGINWLLTVLGHPGNYAWDLRALHR